MVCIVLHMTSTVTPKPEPVVTCQWFLRCEREAITTVAHPILGAVPCCAPCAAFANG